MFNWLDQKRSDVKFAHKPTSLELLGVVKLARIALPDFSILEIALFIWLVSFNWVHCEI